MNTQFKTLFLVKVTHAYYRGNCEDIAFIVPADTAQCLKNGRLLARERAGILYVLFEADDTGTAQKPIPGKTLRIGLQLTNPFFSNFTQADASFVSSSRLYRNAATPAALAPPTRVQLVGHVFGHVLTDGARPVTVTLQDGAGRVLRNETINAADNRAAISYDLTGLASGAYLVEEAFPGGVTRSSYYSDAELTQTGVFGVMEVKIANGFYATPAEFQIDFQARLETLNYYVVARNYTDAEFSQLSVSDAGAGEDHRAQINFDKVPSGSFAATEIPPELLTDSAGKVVLFQSQHPVARTETARKKIQLKKNGDVLIANLPQPRPARNNADLIIPVSKP